jgi:hypothetical protein
MESNILVVQAVKVDGGCVRPTRKVVGENVPPCGSTINGSIANENITALGFAANLKSISKRRQARLWLTDRP